jgi:hypothetical protein
MIHHAIHIELLGGRQLELLFSVRGKTTRRDLDQCAAVLAESDNVRRADVEWRSAADVQMHDAEGADTGVGHAGDAHGHR